MQKNNNFRIKKSSRAVMFATMSSCLLLTACDSSDDEFVNTAPSVPTIDMTEGRELVPFNAMITATDDDGDTLIYTKLSGPSWLSISADGKVTGTPTDGSLGSPELTFRVFDGTDYVEGSSTLTIVVKNRAPSNVQLSALSAMTLTAFEATLSADDLDEDTLTYNKVSGPDWLTLDGTTLSGTPPTAGNFDVVLSASDAEETTEETFTIVVENPNSAPTDLALDNLAGVATAAFTSTISAQDIDGDTLTFAIVDGPAWLTITNDQLLGTPTAAGDVNVTISVDDGEASYSDSFTLVIVEPAPSDTVVTFNDSEIIVNGGEEAAAFTGTLAGTATDLDLDTLTFTKEAGPTWLTIASNGDLTGTFTDAETNTFSVRVADEDGNTDDATLKITHALFSDNVLPAAIAGVVGSTMPLSATDGHDNSNLTFTLNGDDLGGTDDLFEVTADGNIVIKREPLEAEFATVAKGNLAGNNYLLDLSVTDGLSTATPIKDEKIRIRKVYPMGLHSMEGAAPQEWANLNWVNDDATGLNTAFKSAIDHTGDAVEVANGAPLDSTASLRSRRGGDLSAIFDSTGQENITLYYDIAGLNLVGWLRIATQYSVDGVNWNTLTTFSNDDDGTGSAIADQTFTKKSITLPAEANNQQTLWIQFEHNGPTSGAGSGAQHIYLDNVLIQGTAIPAP